MKAVTKLNLNMNPSVCEDGSLVFARNMKVDKDGCLTNDYGYKNIPELNKYNIVGHIVGLDNKIYLFTDTTKNVQIGVKNEYIPFTGELDTIYKHTTDAVNGFKYLENTTNTRHYYFIPSVNGNRNTNDAYKLSHLGYPIEDYDNCFGFYVDYDETLDNPIEQYFIDYFNKIEEIIGLFETVASPIQNIIAGSTLKDSIAQHTFFTENAITDFSVWGVIDQTTTDFEYRASDYIEQESEVDEAGTYITVPVYNEVNVILEFDEITEEIKPIECSWKYHNGKISGCVTTNVSGEKILTIAETEAVNYIKSSKIDTKPISVQQPASVISHSNTIIDATIIDQNSLPTIHSHNEQEEISNINYSNTTVDVTENNTITQVGIGVRPSSVDDIPIIHKDDIFRVAVPTLVPIKHINLNYCKYEDDESVYYQSPKVPIANLNLIGTYAKTIPNGTYVFFIRYQIRKDVYTDWHLCSHPVFAGVSEDTTTLQGGLKYINLHKDSAKSFIFDISFILEENKALYKKFQLGFIISHDESVNARSWKTFDINTKSIYFDYENVEEIDIYDLEKVTYELYNVGNVTPFKNKLYISNYIESDFNPEDVSKLASKITLGVVRTTNDVEQQNLKLDNYILRYNQGKGYYDGLANGGHIASIIGPDMFNMTCGEYIRGESKTKQEAIKFDGQWDSDNDPDMVTIHNIISNIKGESPFGNTWQPNYGNGRLGIVEKYYRNNLWLYGPDYNNLHPWYNLDLTFIYGAARNVTNIPPYLIDETVLFKRVSQNSFHPSGNTSIHGWYCNDKGFSDAAFNRIITNVREEVEGKSRLVRAYVYLTSGATKYKIGWIADYDDDNYVVSGIDEGVNDYTIAKRGTTIKSIVYNLIYNHIVGITQNGTVVLNINGTDIQTNNVTVVYKQYKFEVNGVDDISDASDWHKRWNIDMITTDYSYLCTFNFKDDILVTSSGDISVSKQASSLMPHSTYKAYAHFVDEHNIITNGVYIGTINTGGINKNTDILSLKYSLDPIVEEHPYKAFFISIENVGDKIIECFAYSRTGNNNYIHSIELDALLYNLNDNITVIDNNGDVITTKAKYHSSGESDPPLAFGNCGYVTWSGDTDYTNNVLFVKINTDNRNKENLKLIKATNYLHINEVSDELIYDGFYGAYLCTVKKPDFALSSDCYVSGRDVYKVTRQYPLTLEEFSAALTIQSSIPYMIRSTFNLNYLSLSEDINDQIFGVGSSGSTTKQVAKVINSAILSYIYELKSMYKDFSNIYFREMTEYSKINFDNTIRVSDTLADESFNNSVFKFNPTDYYNIPTDRGVIVKLFSIGNDILVHTKGSFYKFDANSIIVSNDSDIQLKESDPFDAGITQIFDSQYGYGGLDNKEAGCITFDSYFFYDKVSKHIFGYAGNNQILTIDNTIFKFIEWYSPEICRTLHDEKNDRVLFEFVSGRVADANKTYNTFCISYNYKTKTFISLHDLTLLNAFNSRNCCYSYKNNFVSLFTNLSNIDSTLIESTKGTWNIYGAATQPSLTSFGTAQYNKNVSPFSIAIISKTIEYIKESLDSVRYVAQVIQNVITKDVTSRDTYTISQQTRTNPVDRFYAITDVCISSEVKTNVNDAARPNTLLDYKGFKYDLVSWSSNYFRNILNATNIYEYPNQPGTGRDIVSDNNSLVYGRFFVLVFDFIKTSPIKFEDITVNSKKY